MIKTLIGTLLLPNVKEAIAVIFPVTSASILCRKIVVVAVDVIPVIKLNFLDQTKNLQFYKGFSATCGIFPLTNY